MTELTPAQRELIEKLQAHQGTLSDSDFAGRHTQYERFYAGPQFVHALYNFANTPWNERHAYVLRAADAIAKYGLDIHKPNPVTV
mgnify:CR=1 FL=1